jgi:hypothetical protein
MLFLSQYVGCFDPLCWSAASQAVATQQETEVMKEEALQIHETFRPQEAGIALVAQPCCKHQIVWSVDFLVLFAF